MKLLLVLGSNDDYEAISRHIKHPDFELIRYNHVVKAMDNIDEINPQAIIVSARDFPRHWKILVQFVYARWTKEACPIILLKGPGFSTEESTKAFFLGVSCTINEPLDDPTELERLANFLSRRVQVNKRQKDQCCFVEPWHRFGFIFARPEDKLIIPGELKTISTSGISFEPASPNLMTDIKEGTELAECSLRLGGDIYSPVCRIVRSGKIVSMEFVSFPDSGKQVLQQYLDFLSA